MLIPSEIATDLRLREPNLAPTKVARPHTVARLHLRGFALGKMLPTCDMDTGDERSFSVKSATVRKNYYNVKVAGTPLSPETWLSQIEDRAAPLLRDVAADPTRVMMLSEEEEMLVARYVATQRFRVPSHVKSVRAGVHSMANSVRSLELDILEKLTSAGKFAGLQAEWARKSDEDLLEIKEPLDDAELTVDLLGLLPAWTAWLMAMPWRTGRVPSPYTLYTSDNPVATYTPKYRPFPQSSLAPTLWEQGHVLAISPEVLLWIDPMGYGAPPLRNTRRCEDFSPWMTSVARHLISRDADRFLYGRGPYISRECAVRCLANVFA